MKLVPDFIFLLGAQGSGKTTIARLLKERFGYPHIDYDWIRDFHLSKGWKNSSANEVEMSFENLLFILENYKKHGYHNVIVGGFTEIDIQRILQKFEQTKYIVLTLIVTDDKVLKERVLTESRDSSFRAYEESIKFNKRLKEELKFPNEYKIDTANQSPGDTIKQVEQIITK